MECMAAKQDLIIKELKMEDCTPDMLKDFDRYQDVKRCWRKENGNWILKDIPFIEQGDDNEKKETIETLKRCIELGGSVFGAFTGGCMVGFASVDRELTGSKKEYVHMGMLHVSYEHRSKGIGKKMFSVVCERARTFGAGKLYISSHSSEESQAFYKAVGCSEAEETDPASVEKEPCDCQIEFVL